MDHDLHIQDIKDVNYFYRQLHYLTFDTMNDNQNRKNLNPYLPTLFISNHNDILYDEYKKYEFIIQNRIFFHLISVILLILINKIINAIINTSSKNIFFIYFYFRIQKIVNIIIMV